MAVSCSTTSPSDRPPITPSFRGRHGFSMSALNRTVWVVAGEAGELDWAQDMQNRSEAVAAQNNAPPARDNSVFTPKEHLRPHGVHGSGSWGGAGKRTFAVASWFRPHGTQARVEECARQTSSVVQPRRSRRFERVGGRARTDDRPATSAQRAAQTGQGNLIFRSS